MISPEEIRAGVTYRDRNGDLRRVDRVGLPGGAQVYLYYTKLPNQDTGGLGTAGSIPVTSFAALFAAEVV